MSKRPRHLGWLPPIVPHHPTGYGEKWPESQPWQGERAMMCGCRKGDIITVTMPDGTTVERLVISVTETSPGLVDVVLVDTPQSDGG